MTEKKNKEIHTCTKCGTLVWTFQAVDETYSCNSQGGLIWLAGGVFLGLLGAALFDRRR
jgi:hypothetical protein